MRAVGYLRLSKEDINKEVKNDLSKSLINQRMLIEEFAKLHNYNIIHFYIDDDFSGLTMDRPAFQSMISDACDRKFDVIIAKSQSRLSRNMEHIDFLLHDFFPGRNIRFIGITDGVDSDSKAGKKSRQINALVNEWYSEDLSESIRTVLYEKMMQGQYIGTYAPYGYRKSKKDRHKLEVYEPEARVVKMIYKLYLDGFSLRKIAEKLTKDGVTTPVSNRSNISNTAWSKSTVYKILSNEVYTGVIQQGKTKTKSFKDRKQIIIPRDEWISRNNMHEAIIEKEVYEETKIIRHSRSKKK